jgi:hypothetical protein
VNTASKLIKARSEYIKLATSASSVPDNRRNGPRELLRMKAFANLSNAYNEYAKLHGDPEEE